MKRSAAIFLAGAASIGGIAALISCISEHERPVSDSGPPVGVVECDGGGPGGFPPGNCDPSDNTCPSTGGTCSIDTTKCGDPSTCLPLADNSKKAAYDFRLRRLLITAPPSLVGTGVGLGLVQTSVIDKGVDLNAPECGDHGNGAFNWLLHIDPTADQILTGGAPPSPDPFGAGYCFYRHVLGSLDIEPAQVGITFDDGGAFTTAPIALLNVPVFLSPDAGAADPSNVIILPLRNAILKQATLSSNNNCIGAFNLPALDPGCNVADPSSCSKWHTAGSLGGVMTLEDADKVPLTILPETLCVLLSQTSPDPTTHKCMRDGSGNIMAKGDYCSTSNKPGDCQDSFWLSATFAGSAVTINDGSTEPTCQGGTSDAGTDGGGDASDAATD
ncbi:MAG TPA: hypothetical protein VGH28_08605 [Polyangiaceae bacterium]|jgi:hypothetical protein